MRTLKIFTIGTVLVAGFSNFLFQSCKNTESPKLPVDRISNKIDTLIVQHSECTECLDAYILEGTLSVPDSLGRHYPRKDIYLEGNDPYKSEKYLLEKIKMYGYVVKVDTTNSRGRAWSFWVLDWKIINKGE